MVVVQFVNNNKEKNKRMFYQEVILWQRWYEGRFDGLKKIKTLSRPPGGETVSRLIRVSQKWSLAVRFILSLSVFCVWTEQKVQLHLRKNPAIIQVQILDDIIEL